MKGSNTKVVEIDDEQFVIGKFSCWAVERIFESVEQQKQEGADSYRTSLAVVLERIVDSLRMANVGEARKSFDTAGKTQELKQLSYTGILALHHEVMKFNDLLPPEPVVSETVAA